MTIAAQIRELRDLVDAGDMTEAEFNIAKDRVLNTPVAPPSQDVTMRMSGTSYRLAFLVLAAATLAFGGIGILTGFEFALALGLLSLIAMLPLAIYMWVIGVTQ
ncbi:MAG: SHOCT domain-containing protein [Pseudomonadota bacterium]